MLTSSEIIGLDIGYESIKMAEVDHHDGFALTTFGVARHGLDLDGYWDSGMIRTLSKAIHEVLNEGNFDGIKTVLSVRSKDVFVTTMDFDLGVSKKQIESEINSQAPYFLPYAPEEMRLSWSIVNDANYNMQRAVINALPEFVINNSKNLLEHVNLDGMALENQTISQIRGMLHSDYGNTILVDIGSSHTVFSIVVNGVLRSTNFIEYGTDKITKSIAQNLGVEEEVGEFFKRDLSMINLKQVPKPMLNYLKVLRSELNDYIEINTKIGQKPDKIVFTGGGIHTPGLINYFADFEQTIEYGDPLVGMQVSERMWPYVKPAVNQLSTAIGLAKRNDF